MEQKEADGFVHVKENPTARWNTYYLKRLNRTPSSSRLIRTQGASAFIDYLDTIADDGLARNRKAFIRLRNNAVRLKEMSNA